jgi:hypothetical protein
MKRKQRKRLRAGSKQLLAPHRDKMMGAPVKAKAEPPPETNNRMEGDHASNLD